MTDTRTRSTFQVQGAKTGRLPPKEICLSPAEMHELTSMTIQGKSAMDFWKAAFRARGISAPPGRLCAMVYMAPDLFRLEWHRKELGPGAIAAGIAFRQFAEKKDREFAEKRAQ